MKPVLIFDTCNEVKEYCNFKSKYVYAINSNNLEETEEKVSEWYDKNQEITCDNEILLAIITREGLDQDQLTLLENIISSSIRNKEYKVILFSFFQDELDVSYSLKIHDKAVDIFFLGNEDENGSLYINNDEKDKYHIVQILLEYLLENYVSYSQIKQNLKPKEQENIFHSVGAIKYYLSKEILRKNAVKIIEAQNFSKFVFRENFDVNESILKIIDDNSLAYDMLEEIEDGTHNIIHRHTNPLELKIKANMFVIENNILDKDDELIINVHSSESDFENYYLHNENHSIIKSSLSSLRSKAKHHGDVEVKSILEENASNIKDAIQELTGEYKRNKILNIERDFINDFNTRVNLFKKNTEILIDDNILNFGKGKGYGTTNLENVIATLDFIVEGKSEYAENTSKSDSQNLEKIRTTHFDKASGQSETQQQIFSTLRAIDHSCEQLKNDLDKNSTNIYNASRDLLLYENHFKLGFIESVNKYSYLKLSFLSLTNVTFLLTLNILILGLCIYFIGDHYLYWGIPLILINIAFALSSIKKLKVKRAHLENYFDERERVISKTKSAINNYFSTIRNLIKHTYKNKLLKKFIAIVSEERYNIVQMRKYFLFQYYNTILTTQEEINYDSNHIVNVIDANFLKSLILNVTPSSYFNDQKLVEYLHEFKDHNRSISYKFEELDYEELLTVNYDADEVIDKTVEHENNGIVYVYDSIPKATLFNKKSNSKSINSNDIQQGEVGDCYFLAVLAGIAEIMPSLIKNSIIYNKEEDLYSFRFYDNDKNEIYVNIDDKLHSYDGKTNLLYARFDQNQKDILKIWPALFEKAWAKLNGGYENIIGSTSERNITDFGLAITGNYMQFKEVNDFDSEDKLQEFLTKIGFSDKKTVVTLGSHLEPTSTSDPKLITQHAYTLKKALKSTYTLYNPHGQHHFNDIDFNFLKNNFNYIYYFTLNDLLTIKPTKQLSITKKIHLFDSDLEEVFRNSDLNRRIEELNFFDLFWSNDDKYINQKKIEEIVKKSKSLIPFSILKQYNTNKDIFSVSINEKKVTDTKEEIEKELEYRFGVNFNFTDTIDDIFSLIKIKLIIK